MLNDTPRTFVGATTFHVDGMSGQRCNDAVAGEIRRLEGVVGVTIDQATGTADRPVDRVDIATAVKAAGYILRP